MWPFQVIANLTFDPSNLGIQILRDRLFGFHGIDQSLLEKREHRGKLKFCEIPIPRTTKNKKEGYKAELKAASDSEKHDKQIRACLSQTRFVESIGTGTGTEHHPLHVET
eukprot:TCALIF_11988-PA protein Name:"Protein of unknown function" AED:0.30 eAED:0.30 QI:0/0/0.25/0.25/0.66/0.75/4/369/109